MNRQTKITSAAAAVLVGAGVALGLLLGGGSSSAKPVQVQHVDQPIVVVTSTDTVSPVAAPSSADAATISISPATPASTTKAAPVTQPANPNKAALDPTPQTADAPADPSYIAISSLAPGAPIPAMLPTAPTTDMVVPSQGSVPSR
jgi:hypothetical protein